MKNYLLKNKCRIFNSPTNCSCFKWLEWELSERETVSKAINWVNLIQEWHVSDEISHPVVLGWYSAVIVFELTPISSYQLRWKFWTENITTHSKPTTSYPLGLLQSHYAVSHNFLMATLTESQVKIAYLAYISKYSRQYDI